MVIVDVDLGDHTYPIHIDSGLLSKAELSAPHIRGARAMIVTDETVTPLYAAKVEAAVHSLGKAIDTAVLPDGGSFRKQDTLNRIFDALLTVGAGRKITLIALGGSIIGDMTGFATACYMRDVPFIQVPTTLLSQVDSSVGSGTGINYPLGKNIIGAFHQSQVVLAGIDMLCTLPARELAAGMTEVIKHGTIADTSYFARIEQNIKGFNDYDTDLMAGTVRGPVRTKAAVAAQDERETDLRATLNFGYTFGYAIEAGLDYGKWLHDEAVGCDMVMTTDPSHRLGSIDIDTRDHIAALTRATNLPTVAPDLDVDRFIDLMRIDKKAEADEVRFVLLRKLGQAFVTTVPDADLRATLQHAALRPSTEAPIA